MSSVLGMQLGIDGRTAAVAAASAGLGFATAKSLAENGVRVVICGRDGAKVSDAAKRIGHGVVGVECDVSTADGARAFISAAREVVGTIDILVANGGGPPPGNFESTPESEYAGALEKNLLSIVAMCHAVVSDMRKKQWGRIVAITSVAVRQPILNLILSNTARAGVTGFLKTLAREVAVDGITVNTVQPGIHATDRITQLYGDKVDGNTLGIPAGVLGDPFDFGAVTAFLCSEQAKFVTGVQLPVDGGSYAGLL